MIEFVGDCHANNVTISFSRAGADFTAVVGGDGFENALDGLMDGYFLNDWLLETMKTKVMNYFNRHPEMTDAELRRFIEILEAML